ncbi:hypothetical protein EIO00_04925 [Thermomonospora catenispora]|nr:hypothetical protein EIO00_04925 [Thermomonospora catenispora]
MFSCPTVTVQPPSSQGNPAHPALGGFGRSTAPGPAPLAGRPPHGGPGGGRPVVADTGRRILARLVDAWIVWQFVQLAFGAPLALVLLRPAHGEGAHTMSLFIAALTVGGVLAAAAWAFLRIVRVARWGATVGHRIAGIAVVRQQDGGRPGMRRSWDRGFPPLLYRLSDELLAHTRDELGRCLHDRRAGTLVVRADVSPGQRLAAVAVLLFTLVSPIILLWWGEAAG